MSKEKIAPVYIDEDKNVYELRKPVYKKPLFWSTILLSVVSTFLVVIIYLAGIYANGIEEALKSNNVYYDQRDKDIYQLDNNKSSFLSDKEDKSTSLLKAANAFYRRYASEDVINNMTDFVLPAKFKEHFKEEVDYTAGKLTINYARVDTSKKLKTVNEHSGVVVVGMTFKNTSSKPVDFDVRGFFPQLEDGTYPFFDSMFTGDSGAVINGSVITIKENSTVDFAILYGDNEELPEQNIKVRTATTIWE